MNYIKEFWRFGKWDSIIYLLFYCTICFPFFGSKTSWMDTQPWALLLAIAMMVFWLFKEKKWESNFYTNALLCLFAACVVIGIYSVRDITAILSLKKSGANYASIFFITMAAYYMFKRQRGLQELWLKIIIWIWFIVGIIQKYFISDFGYFLLSATRRDNSRGVLSLAAEPSFYGYICFFFLLFALEFKRFRWVYVACLVYQIVFLATSSVTLLYLAVLGFFAIIQSIVKGYKWGYLIIGAGGVSAIAGHFYLINKIPSNRLVSLIRTALCSPKDLLKDVSIGMRIESITTSVQTFANHFGIPEGFSETRITSGYGAMLVEVGFIGVLLILLFMSLFVESVYPVIVTAGLSIVMFSGIPMSCPLFSFYLGYCLYKKNERKRNFLENAKKGVLNEERRVC